MLHTCNYSLGSIYQTYSLTVQLPPSYWTCSLPQSLDKKLFLNVSPQSHIPRNLRYKTKRNGDILISEHLERAITMLYGLYITHLTYFRMAPVFSNPTGQTALATLHTLAECTDIATHKIKHS